MKRTPIGKYIVLLLFIAAAFGFYRWRDTHGVTGTLQRLDFPTAGHIAFVRVQKDGLTNLCIVKAEAQGEVKQLTEEPGSKRAPSWSPDGTRLCYAAETRSDQHTTFQVFLLGGRGAIPATIGSVGKDTPQWSPDGQRIAFLAGGAIKVMRSNGSDVEQLFPRPRRGNAPTDGGDHEGHDHGNEGEAAAEGMKQPPIGSFRWAPTGESMVALQVIEGEMAAAMGQADWWAKGAPQDEVEHSHGQMPEPERLLLLPGLAGDTKLLPGASANRITYAWFKDAKRVAVAISTREGNHAVGLWRADEVLMQPTLIFASTGNLLAPENPAVSPDGSKVAVEMWRLDKEGNRVPLGIAVLPTEDGAGVRVTSAADILRVKLIVKGAASRPQWSPDGQRLLYLLPGAEGRDIWVCGADGSGAINLTNGKGDNFDAVWSPMAG